LIARKAGIYANEKDMHALLAFFELEKALYELRYELNNRADWAQVPLNGVLAILRGDRPG
jgi:maltose alpha-D-glucosyltransferase/alpha-amylase